MATDEFGPLLRSLRERRGVSQSKLAERAEFDHSYVSRLESGARVPSREAVEFLATALDLSSEERDALRQAGGFMPSSAAILLSLPDLAELDALHRVASPQGKEAIRAFVASGISLWRKGAAA